MESSGRSDRRSIPSKNTIDKIETYISKYIENTNGKLPCSTVRWSNANIFKRLAIITVVKSYNDGELVEGGICYGWTWLDKEIKMKELYEYVKGYAEKITWNVYEIGMFEEKDFIGEYAPGMSKYEAVKNNWNKNKWNEERFMPICMEQMFAILKDKNDQISWDRYKYWTGYTVANLVQNKEPLKSSKINDTDDTYMEIELKSPGHKKICERLFDMGYMFFFEAPCKLQNDTKHYRRIDLVVIHNNRALIVEIDGGSHRTVEQQRDDNKRDWLIRKNWTNTLRIEHGDAYYKTEECIEKIISGLDPTRGLIS